MRYTDVTNREGALLHDGVADTLVSGRGEVFTLPLPSLHR
jgi:hypothetical protein